MPGWAPAWSNGLVDYLMMNTNIRDPLDELNDRLSVVELVSYARAYRATAGNVSTSWIYTRLSDFQDNVTGWTLNDGRLVVPSGGTFRYDIHARMGFARASGNPTTDNTDRGAQIRLNAGTSVSGGTLLRQTWGKGNGAAPASVDMIAIGYPLAAGDEISLFSIHNNGGTVAMLNDSDNTFIHVFKRV